MQFVGSPPVELMAMLPETSNFSLAVKPPIAVFPD